MYINIYLYITLVPAVQAMHGSLLRMNKGALAKIAEMAKPAPNVTASKNLRKFVFTALSPEKKTNEEDVKKRPQVSRC